jgi:thiol-disulfide isomerase/thioredoxin
MLTLNLGPLPLPISIFLLLVALLVAAGVGHVVGRDQQAGIGNTLIDMVVVAMVAARIAFVAIWIDTYRHTPWTMLDIRDGGFTPWAGMLAALLMAIWRAWHRPPLRKPLIFGLMAAVMVWGGLFGAIRMMDNTALPKVSLSTLAGEPTNLAELAQGKPMVVNLWATWCPPCRAEMPVLAAAQKQDSAVRFIFVNQGEDGATAQHYLAAAGLVLANVVIDSGAGMGREVGSAALPTTLFYDASGRLVDTHLGALSTASLASKLERMRSLAKLSNRE